MYVGDSNKGKGKTKSHDAVRMHTFICATAYRLLTFIRCNLQILSVCSDQQSNWLFDWNQLIIALDLPTYLVIWDYVAKCQNHKFCPSMFISPKKKNVWIIY